MDVTRKSDSERGRPRILHCFADFGVESEVLTGYGDVVRIGIDTRDLNDSEPIQADANDLPIAEDTQFDLGFFHPLCKKWANMTSISGDPANEPNQIPLARELAHQYCDLYVIENKPQAPLNDPVVLNGRMFGLPIAYERAFETNFRVPQPSRFERFGDDKTAETSPFFYSERSHRWWGSVKGYRADRYPKQHLAKNTIPASYVHHVCRAWLSAYEAGTDIAANKTDYSDYDARMDKQRREELNESLTKFLGEDGDDEE